MVQTWYRDNSDLYAEMSDRSFNDSLYRKFLLRKARLIADLSSQLWLISVQRAMRRWR